MKYIKVKDKEYPAKFNPRVIINWEDATGLIWAEIIPTVDDKGNTVPAKVKANKKQDLMISYEMLKEGHRIERKEFKLSFMDVVDLAGVSDLEAQISKVLINSFTENVDTEKKPKA